MRRTSERSPRQPAARLAVAAAIRTALAALLAWVMAGPAIALPAATPGAPVTTTASRAQAAQRLGAAYRAAAARHAHQHTMHPAHRAAEASAPSFPFFARTYDGHVFSYEPNGKGNFDEADLGGGFGDASAMLSANVSQYGQGNDLYFRMDGALYYTAEHGVDTKLVGWGWDMYSLLAVVDRGSTGLPQIVGTDNNGALWSYQTQADGTLTGPTKIGSGGWDKFSLITGRSDYTGDGKPDLIAKDTSGNLYIYPGTGNPNAEVTPGTRIKVGSGWNRDLADLSTGDVDGDGKADLITWDRQGNLGVIKGTGDPANPFGEWHVLRQLDPQRFFTLF